MKKPLIIACWLFIGLVQAADTIKIGAVLPFSGGLEIFAEQAKAGIDLAVKEVNTAGGIQGRRIEMNYEDNKTDPKTAVEKTAKLIRKEKVMAVLGPVTSNARDAMIPTIKRLRVPLLYATNHEGGLCEPYVFSFNSIPNQELDQLIPAIAKHAGNTFYLFGADYVWPQKMFVQAKKDIKAIGGQVVGESFTPWGIKDFTPTIRKIMASEAKVLVFALPGVDGTTFIKQATELGLSKKMSIAFLGFSETYLSAFGTEDVGDIWVAVPFISTMPSSHDFVKRIKAINPKVAGVSHYAWTHYHAIKAIASALQSAKTINTETLAANLHALHNDDIDMNINNQVDLTMYIGNVVKGQLQQVIDLGKQRASLYCAKP